MTKQEMPFRVGDKVTKSFGKKVMTVTYISGNYITAKYDSSGQQHRDYYNTFKLYEEVNMMTDKDSLFKITLGSDQETWGTHAGTDSQGRFLMEEKGTGKILIVTKDQIEEVLPFTFSVRISGREQHFQGEVGKLKKGDVLLYTAGGADNFAFAVVKSLDTKNKGAKPWQGVKLITEEI